MPEELKLFAVSAVVTDVDRDTGYAREEAQLPAFLVTATDGERAMAKAARVINAPGREARIMVMYRSRHLGYFATKEEAAAVYQRAATEAWGEFAGYAPYQNGEPF